MANVRITLDFGEINEILNSPNGEVVQLVAARMRRVRSLARTYCPKDTGEMAAKIKADIQIVPFQQVKGEISSTDEASWWVNRGTGIYNRDGSTGPIFPRRSQYLRFPDRGGPRPDRFHRPADRGFVFARSVRGQPAQEFMWRGLRDGVRGTRQRWTVTKLLP